MYIMRFSKGWIVQMNNLSSILGWKSSWYDFIYLTVELWIIDVSFFWELED